MDHYLSRRTAHRQGRRAYYTVASLIAMAGPQSHTPGVRPHGDPGLISDEDSLADHLLTAPAEPRLSPAEPDPAAWFARPNLGATLATAVRRAGHTAERTESLLHVLTRLSDDQLHRRLPAPITRLLKDGITPDWAILLHDLVQRTHRRDQVGLRWRDAYYLAASQPRRT
jgi:CRISPR system Cascade subunit CasA